MQEIFPEVVDQVFFFFCCIMFTHCSIVGGFKNSLFENKIETNKGIAWNSGLREKIAHWGPLAETKRTLQNCYYQRVIMEMKLYELYKKIPLCSAPEYWK